MAQATLNFANLYIFLKTSKPMNKETPETENT